MRFNALAHRRSALGRVCVSCAINDSEAVWSNVRRFCDSCQRSSAPSRNGGICRCGFVLRRPLNGAHATGLLLCRVCDEDTWRELGFSRTTLMHPTDDDRERIIWRKTLSVNKTHPLRTCNGFGPFPEFMSATAKQWKTWR